MADPAVISFSDYGWETSFAAVSTAINKSFGHGVRVTTLSRKNNIQKIYGQGYRNAQKLVPMKYEGAKTVEFVLANPWFFESFLGSTTTTGSAPYIHTFSEQDTVKSFTIFNQINSDTKSCAKLLGCKAANINISAAVGELVRVRMDVPYANETFSSTTAAQNAETFDVFTFANATLEIPNATTISDVQNIDLNLGQNPEYVFGCGSRFAQKGPVKTRDYNGKVTIPYEAFSALLQLHYGGTTGPVAAPAETATLELTFDNGLTGSNMRKIVMLYTGVQLDEHNLPQDPTALILEDVSLHMRSLTVTCSDATATIP